MIIQPSAVPNLPQALADSRTSPAVVRKGTVAGYYATRLAVYIGGATTTTDAAFVSSYKPVLGDSVSVAYQDGTWTVLGTYGGPMAGNTAVANHSFEDGAVGAAPPNWQVVSTSGSPTLTTALWPRDDFIDGPQVGQLSVAATSSVTTNVVSAAIPVVAGTKWACAAYVATTNTYGASSTACTVRLLPSWYPGPTISGLLSQDTSGDYGVFRGMPWTLLRAQSNAGFTVPAGASYLRVQLGFVWNATAGDTIYIDRIIARRLS